MFLVFHADESFSKPKKKKKKKIQSIEIKDKPRNKILRAYLVSKCGVSTFHFLYSIFKF